MNIYIYIYRMPQWINMECQHAAKWIGLQEVPFFNKVFSYGDLGKNFWRKFVIKCFRIIISKNLRRKDTMCWHFNVVYGVELHVFVFISEQLTANFVLMMKDGLLITCLINNTIFFPKTKVIVILFLIYWYKWVGALSVAFNWNLICALGNRHSKFSGD